MPAVRVLYFAAVRDLVGTAEEQLELPENVASVGALASHLQTVHPELRGRLDGVRIAVNEEFAGNADPVAAGDVIALIPPVAGG